MKPWWSKGRNNPCRLSSEPRPTSLRALYVEGLTVEELRYFLTQQFSTVRDPHGAPHARLITLVSDCLYSITPTLIQNELG